LLLVISRLFGTPIHVGERDARTHLDDLPHSVVVFCGSCSEPALFVERW